MSRAPGSVLGVLIQGTVSGSRFHVGDDFGMIGNGFEKLRSTPEEPVWELVGLALISESVHLCSSSHSCLELRHKFLYRIQR